MPAKKLNQIIPQTLSFTPAGGTAVVFTDFADPVAFSYSVSYGDISSQSADYAIGQLLTGREATLKATMNNFDLSQLVGIVSGKAADYASATDALSFKSGSFDINVGVVTFVGYDTLAKKTVTIAMPNARAMVSGDLSFGKDQEVRVGVEFKALKPTTGDAVTITYAV